MSNTTISVENHFQNIISHAKEYGFVFPSSEIYDGLAAVYDYGQAGVELRRNLREYWWKSMVQMHDNIVGIDAAIFMHPTTWKASGHVDSFSDPMVDNKDSKKRYRVDVLIEDEINRLYRLTEQAFDKKFNGYLNTSFFGIIHLINQNEAKQKSSINNETTVWNFNDIKIANQLDFEKVLIDHIPEYLIYVSLKNRFEKAINENDFKELGQILVDYKIQCPIAQNTNWTDVRQFNLMFSTQMGSVADDSDTIYLRPETAQGIFVNFLNVQKTGRMKIPFGIAQTGKAFRNEIVARQFIFRMKEFEQMEMQFFVRPGTEMEWYNLWKQKRMAWHKSLGIPENKLRFHDHTKLAHYANAAVDIEFEFPFGFKEVEGIHSRTDFDLKQHELFSKKKMQYFDNDVNPETGKPYGNYVPFVVETSVGLDRLFLLTLSNAFEEQILPKEDGTTDSRSVLHLPPILSPYKAAILPLMKKDGLPEAAKEIAANLRKHYNVFYEEKDTIGKRYRRMDALGTPFCICVDHQTLTDQTVTVRYRDSMTQDRIHISEIKPMIDKAVEIF
ncbi:MAG: hypothetical protein RL708_2486 [Bacteroidota bacterium]|jgi:glycyl-tRNA synthetase